MTITIEDIEVSIKPIRNPRTILAQATLTFGNLIEIRGFTISKSQHIHPKFQEKVWIQPPKIQAGVYWVKLVFIQDENLWASIEEKIYDKFRLKFGDTLTDENNEEINIDEIPI